MCSLCCSETVAMTSVMLTVGLTEGKRQGQEQMRSEARLLATVCVCSYWLIRWHVLIEHGTWLTRCSICCLIYYSQGQVRLPLLLLLRSNSVSVRWEAQKIPFHGNCCWMTVEMQSEDSTKQRETANKALHAHLSAPVGQLLGQHHQHHHLRNIKFS